MRLFTLAVLLLLSQSPPPDTQIGDWVFRLPKGVRVVTGSAGQPVLAWHETPDNLKTSIFLLTGRDLDEPLGDWLKREWGTLKQTFTFAEDAEPAESKTSTGATLAAMAGRGTDARGREWTVMLAGLRMGKRAAPILLVTDDADRIQAVLEALDALADSATFASARPREFDALKGKLALRIDPTSTPSFLWDPAPELPRGDAGLEGLYGTTGLGAREDPLTGGAVKFRYRYFTFLADGRVLRECPPEGLLAFRFEHWAAHFINDAGRYVVKDGAVEMTFRTPRGESRETLARRDGKLFDGEKPCPKLRGDAAALEGRFLRHDHAQFAESQLRGITFTKDGRFQDEAFNSNLNLGWWVGSDYSLRDIEPVPGEGRWRVAKNTLELIYDDGRRRRFGFHLYGDEPEEKPRAFVVNGRLMVRVP